MPRSRTASGRRPGVLLARGLFAAACLLAAGLLSSCRTAESLGRAAARLTPEGRRILAEFDRYARLAKTLRRFHDSGDLDEDAVIDVLVAVGVIPAPPPRPGRPAPKPPPTGPKPFPVPRYEGAWRWPLDAGVVSSEFGPRHGRRHNGIDVAADRGSPVFAAAPGEVVYSGDGLSGYGNVVFIRHDQDRVTIYAHNDANEVKAGDKVARDRRVARLGSTGRSTGPHVHFEVRVKNRAVNPRTILPKRRF